MNKRINICITYDSYIGVSLEPENSLGYKAFILNSLWLFYWRNAWGIFAVPVFPLEKELRF